MSEGNTKMVNVYLLAAFQTRQGLERLLPGSHSYFYGI